jgi:hypothetical protein
MAASAYYNQVQNLYVTYFGRPADKLGLEYYANLLDKSSGNQLAMLHDFAASAESTALYNQSTTSGKINAMYMSLFGRAADIDGLAYWVNQVQTGKVIMSEVAATIAYGAQAADAAIVAAKLTAAATFTAGITTVEELLAYENNTAIGRTWLAGVTSAATATAAAATVDSTLAGAVTSGSVTPGSTFTLTTAIDTLTGGNGNDTFISDNASVSAADQINGGAGTDTLKLYTSVTKPVISNIENIYLNAPGGDFSIATVTGATSLEVDGETGSRSFSGTTGQKFIFDNLQTTGQTQTIAGNTPTSLDVVVNKVGSASATQTLAFTGTALTTINLTAQTAASTFTLTNAGAKLATLKIAGDKAVTITEALATLTTIDASASTGGVVAKTGGSANVLTFTGGSGNDAVWVNAGEFTGADKLDGGTAGTDKIVIAETGALTAQNYTDLNTYKNFDVLGFGASGATVDLSKLTNGINAFAVEEGNFSASVSNSLSTTKYTIDNNAANSGTVTIANKVGETSTTVAIDNQSGASKTLAALTLTGATNVALSSTGKVSSVNVITTLTNSDNSAITVTGDKDLTFSLTATTVGSKVDGAAFTGKLDVTGNTAAYSAGSSLGDILIGGSGIDTLKAAVNGGSLTGNAGADTFNVSVAVAGGTTTAAMTTITDFTKGDKLVFGGTAGGFAATKLDLSAAASETAAINILLAGGNSDVKWGVYNGNTYIADDVGAGATVDAADTIVKLTGTLDLSTSTFAAATVTFA